MKKRLIVIAVIGLLLLVLPLMANASTVDSGNCGENTVWTLDDEGILTISGTGDMYEYYYNRHPWMDYVVNEQNDQSAIQSVVIENGVTSIGQYAFSGLGFQSISIPNSVKSIGMYAFDSCKQLTGIRIPENVTSIGSYAFQDCSSLAEANIPKSLENIGYMTFYNCSSLTKIRIPDGVKSIGSYAFSRCSSLENVILPDGLTTIDTYAFSRCENLTYIAIPDSVESIGKSAFYDCRKLERITIPDGITSIEDSVFDGCRNLEFITIPDSVTSIGMDAFYGCGKLTSITLPDGIKSVGVYAFQSYPRTTIYASLNSDSAKAMSKAGYAFRVAGNPYDCKWLYSNDSITGLEISNCDQTLTSLVIPDNVTSIGEDAFSGCKELTSVVIPQSVTSIGKSAFYECSSLLHVVIPDNVSNIGDHAFCNCYNLISVTMPSKITSIEYGTFWSCHDLRNVTIPAGVTRIGEYAFCNVYDLKGITIPDSVRTIEKNAFNHCNGLETITIPEGVTSIGENAFCYCAFSSVTIPASVSSIGNKAFYENENLKKISILSQNAEIGTEIFKGTGISVSCYQNSSAATWAENLGYSIIYLDDPNAQNDYTIVLPKNFTLGCGYSRNLHACVYPAGDPTQIQWSSDHPEVVSVENGTVTAVSAGTATITATFGNSSNTVTVTAYIPAEQIILEETEIYAIVKQWVAPPAYTCVPSNSQTYLTWDTSSDGTISGYEGYGNEVKSEYPGNIYMLATSAEGLTATCVVHYFYPVTAVSFDREEMYMATGTTQQLTATVKAQDKQCLNHLVTFSSSNEAIATVDTNGLVTAVAAGDVTITATSKSDKSAFVRIHIVTPCETHEPAADPAIPATCTQTGLTEGSHCAVCGEILTPQEIIPVQNHDWGEAQYTWAEDFSSVIAVHKCGFNEEHQESEIVGTYTKVLQEATCEETGLFEYVSDQFANPAFTRQTSAQQVLSALGHDLEHHEAKAATCTEIGYNDYDACRREGCTYTTYTEIPALKHDLEHHDAKAATCTEIGWNEYDTCRRNDCGYSTYEEIAALGHALVHHDAQVPTDTAAGWDEYDSCSREGCDYTTRHILTTDIFFRYSPAPTCTTDGIAKYVCDQGNNGLHYHNLTVKATGHTEETDDAVAATCTDPGLTEGKHCSVCGEILVAQETVPAGGHALTAHPRVDTICTEEGTEAYWECEVCHKLFSDAEGKTEIDAPVTIPAGHGEHDLEHHEAKAATCTEKGWNAYDTCKREGCNYSTYTEIPAGHDLEHHEAKAATCTEKGWNAYDTCKRNDCTYSTYVEIPALKHDLEHHDAKEATCTEKGWNEYDTCRRDGCNYTTYTEVTKQHTLVAHKKVDSTCTQKGTEAYWSCDACQKLFSDADARTEIKAIPIISEKAHTETEDAAKAPTCTETGLTAGKHCSVCGTVTSQQNTVPQLGHDWETKYEWADDNSTVTATHTCKNDASHTETETVSTAIAIVSPTENEKGSVTYSSADFTKEGFTKQTKLLEIPALSNMSVIRLPDKLQKIDDEAFENLPCEAIIIPNSCTTIGHYAFRNCKNLKYIKVPQNTEIPTDALEGCGNVLIDRSSD